MQYLRTHAYLVGSIWWHALLYQGCQFRGLVVSSQGQYEVGIGCHLHEMLTDWDCAVEAVAGKGKQGDSRQHSQADCEHRRQGGCQALNLKLRYQM